jgi:preprotein translocase subunit YajC
VAFVIIMVLVLGVMYVTMIRPQRQRQAQQQWTVESAGVGDDVLTTGGIYGTITEVEGDDIVVEIAPALTVHMTRRGIAAVLPPDEEDEEPEADGAADADADDDADEGAVRDGEEAVRSAAGDVPSADEHR